jgi:putative acetyltransferase
MLTNLFITPMTMDDFAEVLRLWQNTEGIGLNESDTASCIARYLERNPGLSFVARLDGKIVGAVLCGHDGRRAYLHHLAVANAHRRQGIGGKLVDACLRELESLQIPKCNIFLFADNAEGESFWQHNSWNHRADLRVMQKGIIQSKSQIG